MTLAAEPLDERQRLERRAAQASRDRVASTIWRPRCDVCGYLSRSSRTVSGSARGNGRGICVWCVARLEELVG